MALLTLAEAKDHLKLDVATWDTRLQAMVDGVTTVIESKIEGPAVSRTVVETVSLGDGGRAIPLRQRGFVSLTSITANAVSVPTTDVVASPTGRVLRRRGGQPFTPSTPPVVVTYVAGYGAGTPEIAALKEAAKIIVGHNWETQRGRAGGRGGVSANSELGSTATVVPGLAYAIPNRAMQWMAFAMPETGLA